MADINKQSTDVQTQSPSIDERFHQYLQSYHKQNNREHPVFRIAHALARSLADTQAHNTENPS